MDGYEQNADEYEEKGLSHGRKCIKVVKTVIIPMKKRGGNVFT